MNVVLPKGVYSAVSYTHLDVYKRQEFTVTRVQWQHFAKHGTRPVTLLAVTYEGILQVTDAEQFRALLCQGMGRGKAYGLGLMTVMRGGN